MSGARRLVAACAALLALAAVAGCSDDSPVNAAKAELAPVGAPPAPKASATDRVSALGRIEPEDGLMRLAGPSGRSGVIGELFVDDGDPLQKGQLIATLDTIGERKARVERLEAELAGAQRDLARYRNLNTVDAASDSQRDVWETRVSVTRAKLHESQAALENAHVRSPIAGRVLDVHARQGERVGSDGILELGAHRPAMFAIAEVYETDIGRVAVGQRARVTSPVLPKPLGGVVELDPAEDPQAGRARHRPGGPQGRARRRGRDPSRRQRSRPPRSRDLQVEVEIDP